ncbi:MAG: DUF6522 family protein [Cypionkella sp.]
MIEFEGGTIQVRAEDVSRGLKLTAEEVMLGIRDGTITSLCEKGQEADAGRYRLTFYSPKRRLRLTCDAQGVILKRSSSDHMRKPLGQPPNRDTESAQQPSPLLLPLKNTD